MIRYFAPIFLTAFFSLSFWDALPHAPIPERHIDCSNLFAPLNPATFERIRKPYFHGIYYALYLRHRRAQAPLYRDLGRLFELWEKRPAYAPLVRLLRRHPVPVVLTPNLSDDWVGLALPVERVLLLNQRMLYRGSESQREWMRAYYIAHELLHFEFPHLEEYEVHDKTLEAVAPLQHLFQLHYNENRYLVDRARAGDVIARQTFLYEDHDDSESVAFDTQPLFGGMRALSRALHVPENDVAYRSFKDSDEGIVCFEFLVHGRIYWTQTDSAENVKITAPVFL